MVNTLFVGVSNCHVQHATSRRLQCHTIKDVRTFIPNHINGVWFPQIAMSRTERFEEAGPSSFRIFTRSHSRKVLPRVYFGVVAVNSCLWSDPQGRTISYGVFPSYEVCIIRAYEVRQELSLNDISSSPDNHTNQSPSIQISQLPIAGFQAPQTIAISIARDFGSGHFIDILSAVRHRHRVSSYFEVILRLFDLLSWDFEMAVRLKWHDLPNRRD